MYINVNDLSLINLSEMCWYFYHMALWQSLLLGHVVTKPLHVQLLFCWIWPFEFFSETELNFCLLIFIKEIYPPHGNSGDHISVICRYKAAFLWGIWLDFLLCYGLLISQHTAGCFSWNPQSGAPMSGWRWPRVSVSKPHSKSAEMKAPAAYLHASELITGRFMWTQLLIYCRFRVSTNVFSLDAAAVWEWL